MLDEPPLLPLLPLLPPDDDEPEDEPLVPPWLLGEAPVCDEPPLCDELPPWRCDEPVVVRDEPVVVRDEPVVVRDEPAPTVTLGPPRRCTTVRLPPLPTAIAAGR